MLSKIIGSIWVVLGILWLIRPQMLQNRLKRKLNRKLRWIVYGFIIVFGFMMAGSMLKTPGILPKLIAVVGLVIAIKAMMMITSKTSEKILEWLGSRSLLFFRITAFAFLALGILMLVNK
jgi:hypothetical protein